MGKKISQTKDCHCHTCAKDFHSLGIMSHRAGHRNRNEDCKITFTYGNTVTYNFSQQNDIKNKKSSSVY